jgi:signal peptidase II
MLFFAVAVTSVIADQFTKFYVFGDKLYIDEVLYRHEFSKSFYIAIETAANHGAVAGIGQGMNVYFALLSAMFLVLMVPFFLHYLPRAGAIIPSIAGGLAWGGVMGNFIDRIAMGAVRDFITVAWWPTFNIADACICCGVTYFAYAIIFDKHSEKTAEAA